MRLPLWGTLLTILGIAVLCGLGTWQLQRLHWKQDMLARIAAQQNNFRQFTHTDFTPQNEYASGEAEGFILYESEFAIGPRTRDGEPGYHIVTPLQLANDDHILLVNRGWVPLDYKVGTHTDEQEEIAIAGMIRTPDKGNAFTPENNPAKDQWYKIDIAQIAQAKGLKNILPVMLYESPNALRQGHGPDSNALTFNIPNNHLQYALFWFGMAIAMASIYALRFLRRK